MNFDLSSLNPLNRKRVLGLDIGSYGIKMVHLTGRGAKRKLNAIALERISPEVIVDGTIMNADALTQAIGEILAVRKGLPRTVASSLGGSSVIIKQVPLPKMSSEDLFRNLAENVAEHIPFPLDEVSVDFHIIGDDRDAPDRMLTFVVAAKKDMINEYTGIILESKLKPMVLDVDAFAVSNCFAFNYPELAEETVAIVNVGAAVTNVSVVRGGSSIFVRDITKGGYQVTEEIQKTLGVSFEDAETFKRGGDENSEELIPEEVGSIIRNSSQSIADDIQRSVDYYGQMTGGEDPVKVFLSGGMALVSGMDRIIEDKVGLPVEILNPFKQIDINNKHIDLSLVEKNAPIFTVAVGLALREVGDL